MTLTGKGMMIWQLSRVEKASTIVSLAKAAGFTHVLIKIADGSYTYNVDKTTGKDLVPEVVDALHANGIQAWGWHYVYGNSPTGEAQIAIKRVKQLDLDGYVIDAEGEYKTSGRDVAAATFMSTLRASLPNTPIALCSYRWPTLHPQLPWKQFLEKCDYNMPQVYWQDAHNPAAQLKRCVTEFKAMTPFRPIVPTGPVYKYASWEPTSADISEFLTTAKELELSAANFFEWYYGRTILTSLWNTIAAFDWGDSSSSDDYPTQFIKALNTRNVTTISNLYASNAVLVTSAKTVQGTANIQSYFSTLLNQKLPGATFTLTGSNTSGNTRHFSWKATSSSGSVSDGKDTLGILDGKIAYHYSYYSII